MSGHPVRIMSSAQISVLKALRQRAEAAALAAAVPWLGACLLGGAVARVRLQSRSRRQRCALTPSIGGPSIRIVSGSPSCGLALVAWLGATQRLGGSRLELRAIRLSVADGALIGWARLVRLLARIRTSGALVQQE